MTTMLNLAKLNEIVSPIPQKNLVASAFVGAVLGGLSSLVVNACLLEISVNGFFTIYFSIIFMMVGGFMLYRAYQKTEDSPGEAPEADQTFMRDEKDKFFIFAALFVLASGLLTVFLEKDWARNFPYILKAPIYMLVAMTLCYLVLFALIDLVNFFCSRFMSENSLNVVESNDQVLSLLLACFGCGTLYGLIFTIMDVEDLSFQNIRRQFFYEETLCVPIGVVGGAVAGLANEILRNNAGRIFMVINGKSDPFDEEI